jgi:hypothetical protein
MPLSTRGRYTEENARLEAAYAAQQAAEPEPAPDEAVPEPEPKAKAKPGSFKAAG